MATAVVSNNSQLVAALNSATQDSVIQLQTGTYSLSLRNKDFHDATITAATGADVSFSGVTLNAVSNLHFDGVDFADSRQIDVRLYRAVDSSNLSVRNATFDGVVDSTGFGRGTGVSLAKVTGFVLEDVDISGFKSGAWIGSTTDLTVRYNKFSDISQDGMIVGGVHDALFEGNRVELHIPAGLKHTDAMQFYNTGANNPLTDVVIRDNHIETHNSTSHGIYLANGLANDTGSAATFFQNVTIENNVVVASQVSAIAVGQTRGLDVHDNILLQDAAFPSARVIHTPAIRIHQASTDVSVTDNVVHIVPKASGANWAPVKGLAPDGWTIADNEIVPLGSTLDSLPHDLDPAPPQPEPVGNGVAVAFRLDAVGETDIVDGLDFSEGDTIELYGYKGGTFFGQKGGNELIVTVNGAVFDSLADIHELDDASAAVSVRDAGGDTLAMDIVQKAGTHSIEIHNIASDYFNLA